MIKKLALLWFVILLPLFVAAQENNRVLAAITIEPTEKNMATIGGLCTNHTAQTMALRYELSVRKRSQSGNTNDTSQSGNLFLEPEESKTLSTTTINVEAEDRTEIVLTLFDADNVQLVQSRKWLNKADLLKE